MRLNPYFIGLFFFALSSSALANNENIQNNLAKTITANQPAQLALLKKLVNINSGTENTHGVSRVGQLLRRQFAALGFKVHFAKEPAYMHKAPTLIAVHTGNQGQSLLLIGHLDTVAPAHGPFQHFKKQGNTARGSGVIDDKGGDVVILYALKALKAAHALDHANITVVLTGDEEESGKPTSISRKPLLEAAQQKDIALDFELGASQSTATIARRGISNWTLTTFGLSKHSSLIFEEGIGDGAIFELARILNIMRDTLSHERYLTFSPGLILGGKNVTLNKNNTDGTAFGKENIIAETALAKGDLRFMNEAQKSQAEEKISAIVKNNLPDTHANITFQDGIPAMPPTTANLDLLNQYSDASIALGYGPVHPLDPGSRGAGDISFVAGMVKASLGGLGPCGSGAHSENETLDIPSLTMQTERAALFIYRQLQGSIAKTVSYG